MTENPKDLIVIRKYEFTVGTNKESLTEDETNKLFEEIGIALGKIKRKKPSPEKKVLKKKEPGKLIDWSKFPLIGWMFDQR